MAGYREVQLVHTEATVGATSVVALAANADRSYVKFYNDSDAVIYLKFGATAVANEGIGIPVAGSYVVSADNGNLDTRVVNAISTAAAKELLISEAS